MDDKRGSAVEHVCNDEDHRLHSLMLKDLYFPCFCGSGVFILGIGHEDLRFCLTKFQHVGETMGLYALVDVYRDSGVQSYRREGISLLCLLIKLSV